MAQEINETVGDFDLCAWRVAPGWVWVQTRLPEAGKVLSYKKGFRQVAYAVGGGYMRTFEAQMTLKQAESLITKLRQKDLYISTEKRGLPKAKSSERGFSQLRA